MFGSGTGNGNGEDDDDDDGGGGGGNGNGNPNLFKPDSRPASDDETIGFGFGPPTATTQPTPAFQFTTAPPQPAQARVFTGEEITDRNDLEEETRQTPLNLFGQPVAQRRQLMFLGQPQG